MTYLGGNGANELEAAIDARRAAEHMDGLLLQAFEPAELAALSTDNRRTLDMLMKRRMRQAGTDLSVEDCLRIRQQFEDYLESKTSALFLAAQLR